MSEGKNKQVKKQSPKKKRTLIVVISVIAVVAICATVLTIIRYNDRNQPTPMPEPARPCYGPECRGAAEKPILYLYPTETTNVTVNFAHPERLTTTYPKYYGGWNVTAEPNGNLTDTQGNHFYALYWEENTSLEADQSTAFYVEKDGAIDFLEEKLSIIGLNYRERNEMITYWLPIIEQNEKNIIRFIFTEDIQANNTLNITPKPDSMLRVYIVVEKTDSNPNLPEPILPSFERKGFTVVEWGGINL